MLDTRPARIQEDVERQEQDASSRFSLLIQQHFRGGSVELSGAEGSELTGRLMDSPIAGIRGRLFE